MKPVRADSIDSVDGVVSVDDRRIAEVDAALSRVNAGIAAIVAAAALLFWPLHGTVFLAFSLVPIGWWSTRLVGLHRRIGLEAWNAALGLVISVAICGGAVASGGHTSPVVFFAGLVGLFVHIVLPEVRFPSAAGALIILVVTSIDIVRGIELDAFQLAAAGVIAVYLPISVQQLVAVEQIQRRRAVLDALTGCLNRRSLEERSAEIEAQAERIGTSVAVISFDIDHFKQVNDTHGHPTGDRMLAHVAYVARKQLRRFELLFRTGGEEFVVIVPGMCAPEATQIAERIRRAIAETTLDSLSVTASFGVAAADAPFAMEHLLDTADRRMYQAKRAGRDRVIGDPCGDHDARTVPAPSVAMP